MNPRTSPYLAITWLKKLLTGEDKCEYAAWFKSHFENYPKPPSDFNSAQWNMDHTELLNKIAEGLKKRDVKFFIEKQNKFYWKGEVATLGGVPDLVAIESNQDHRVYDAKTGKPRDSDIVQVKIAMWALPKAVDKHRGARMSGEVVYQSHSVAIPPESVDKAFENQVVQLVKRVAAAQEASAYPSEYECKFCDIQDCKYRFGTQQPIEAEVLPVIQEVDIVEVLEPLENEDGARAEVGESVVAVTVHGDNEAYDLERVHEDGSGDLFYSVPASAVRFSCRPSRSAVVDSTIVDSIDVRPGTVTRIEGDVETRLSNLVLPLGTFTNDTPFDGVIYDIEIERGIPDGPKEDDIVYCNGWEDYRNMGISTACAYDYVEDAYRVFCYDNFEEFLALLSRRKWIVGFNSLKFDNHVLEEYVSTRFPLIDSKDLAVGVRVRSYDILVEIWKAEGLREIFNVRTHGGYGLDAVCNATFGIRKTGNGAQAPADWQRRKVGTVIDYCINDVKLTKRLMDSILQREPLVNPKRGGELILRHPED